MRIPKDVKTGDVLDLTKKDIIFINTCFAESNNAKYAAEIFMTKAREKTDRAWRVISAKWPKLAKYHLCINMENRSMVVHSERKS